MARWAFAGLLLLSLPLCAATCMDTATGTRIDPETGKYIQEPGGGPLGHGGGLAGMWFPWATAATSLIANVWLAIRNRNWSAAATSTITGVEAFFRTAEGAKVKEALKDLLIKEHDKLGVQPIVGKVLDRLTGVEKP